MNSDIFKIILRGFHTEVSGVTNFRVNHYTRDRFLKKLTPKSLSSRGRCTRVNRVHGIRCAEYLGYLVKQEVLSLSMFPPDVFDHTFRLCLRNPECIDCHGIFDN